MVCLRLPIQEPVIFSVIFLVLVLNCHQTWTSQNWSCSSCFSQCNFSSLISDHAEVRGHSSFPPTLLPAGSPGVGVGGDPGQRWWLQVRTYRLWCPVGRIQYRCKNLITQLYWLTVNPSPLLNFFLCGILHRRFQFHVLLLALWLVGMEKWSRRSRMMLESESSSKLVCLMADKPV